MEAETITISMDVYNSLVEDSQWLASLENAGVDNWSGIDFAQDLHRESYPEEDL